MRKALLGLALIFPLSSLATPASADSLPYTASLTIEQLGFEPFVFHTSGTLEASVTGGSHINNFTLPAVAFSGTLLQPVTPSVIFVAPFPQVESVGVSVVNATGAFQASGVSNGSGIMPIGGAGIVKIEFSNALTTATFPWGPVFGSPGTLMFSVLSFLPVTVEGNPFTTKTTSALSPASSMTITRMGGQSTSTSSTTGGGVIKRTNLSYVTAIRITYPAVDSSSFVFGRLDIQLSHPVPEPGIGIVIALGIVGLWIAGRRP